MSPWEASRASSLKQHQESQRQDKVLQVSPSPTRTLYAAHAQLTHHPKEERKMEKRSKADNLLSEETKFPEKHGLFFIVG